MPEQGVALSLKKIVATSPFLLSAPLMQGRCPKAGFRAAGCSLGY